MPVRKGSIDKNFADKAINNIKKYIKPAVAVVGFLGVMYVQNGCETHAWTYQEIVEYSKLKRLEQQKNIEKQAIVKQEYGELFRDAKTLEDSINIYNKFDALRDNIRLKQVSIEDMEKSVEQSKLESKL